MIEAITSLFGVLLVLWLGFAWGYSRGHDAATRLNDDYAALEFSRRADQGKRLSDAGCLSDTPSAKRPDDACPDSACSFIGRCRRAQAQGGES